MRKIHDLRLLTEQEEGYGIISEFNTSRGCSGVISLDIQDKTIIKEYADKSEADTIFMNCILQKCDTQNRNGRYYPRTVLVREDSKYQTLITEGRALGEANHPESSQIDLLNPSHRIIKTWWEGETLHGVLEILTSLGYHKSGIISCSGDHIADLLRRGVKLGISSRGLGTLKNIAGKNTVQDDFDLVCYDIVASPSTIGAFLYPNASAQINEENRENGVIITENKLIKNLDKFLF